MTEVERGISLESRQVRHLFATHRRPGAEVDGFECSELRAGAESFVLAVRGHLFQVPLLMSVADAEAAARWRRTFEQAVSGTHANEHPVGIGTSLGRSEWAELNARLSPGNEASFRAVHEALFLLALDGDRPGDVQDCIHFLRDDNYDNRYFDKSLQIVVFDNGKAGLNFEHGVLDGHVVHRFASELYTDARNTSDEPAAGESAAVPLTWKLTPLLRQEVLDCVRVVRQTREHLGRASRTLRVEGWGADGCRARSIHSDALFQLVWQVQARSLKADWAGPSSSTSSVSTCSGSCPNSAAAWANAAATGRRRAGGLARVGCVGVKLRRWGRARRRGSDQAWELLNRWRRGVARAGRLGQALSGPRGTPGTRGPWWARRRGSRRARSRRRILGRGREPAVS